MAQINDQAPPLPATVAVPVQNFVMSMIAKKPEDRPASTAIVARAATALRRGDIAAAVAAVPAIGAGVDDATQLLTQAGATSATTRLMPSAVPVEAAAAEQRPPKKRSPWTWPLIALIALLIIVLAGTLWAIFGQPSGGADPSKSPSTPSRATSPSVSQTETAAPVNVGALGLESMSCDDAAATLTENELIPKREEGSPAPSKDKVGYVEKISNTGNATPGDTITLTCYTAQTEITTKPKAATITGEDGQVVEGGHAIVTLPDFTCPSGTGNLSGYTVTATNGQFINGSNSGNTSTISTGASPGDLQLTVTGKPTDTLTVSYTATCSGGNGDLTSPSSPDKSVTINPAPSPSTPPAEGQGDGTVPEPGTTDQP
jgi:serine/threonine-protein kinase